MRYGKKPEFTVASAGDLGMLVKIKCGLCRITHHYRPDDIITLVGDVALWDIAPAFRCEKCKSREYLKADWTHVRGPDVGTVTVRRLVRIRMVRIPVWRDEVV